MLQGNRFTASVYYLLQCKGKFIFKIRAFNRAPAAGTSAAERRSAAKGKPHTSVGFPGEAAAAEAELPEDVSKIKALENILLRILLPETVRPECVILLSLLFIA